MIPIRLELKDFLSYAEPEPLDFTSFDVACLSGDNGVGKSALLDAITWALFGTARGCEGGQNQDRLIRDGCMATMVDFTFSLGGATYRIVRRRSRTAKGDTKGDVRFLVADGDVWKNIAAETLKATDAKISSVMRMDYPTFTASAFFLQGRSEDFLARMRPDERKEVFARLLDLGAYEQLEDAARLRAREAERSRQDAAARVGELESQTVDIRALEEELAEIASARDAIAAELRNAQDAAQGARRALAAIETKQALLAREQDELRAAEALVADALARIDAAKRELAEIDELAARADEAEAALRRIAELRQQDEDARSAQQEAAELRRRAAELAATVEAERRNLTARLRDAEARMTALERESVALDEAEAALVRIAEELDGGADVVEALDDARRQLREREIAAATMSEQIRALDERIATTNDALAILEAGGGECPVCGSTLDPTHRAEARKRLRLDVETASGARQAARAAAATERKEAKRIAEEVRRLEQARGERERLQAEREALGARLERLDGVRDELAGLTTAVRSDTAALEAGPLPDVRREAQDLERFAAERYDAESHGEVRAALDALAPFAALAGRIDEAVRRRGRVTLDLSSAEQRHAEATGDVGERLRRIGELMEAIQSRDEAADAVRTAERAVDDAAGRGTELAERGARLEQALDNARRVACELETARCAERALATEHRRYRRLVEAFGRGGIPDLVIDNVLPQLEDDANRILGRLSDHEMSVHFVLQRDTKSGKAKDTFEALVHHDGGARDYAMFSGGEAFRVAFAVRLAMSKLLVHRAGARLETLVIDEGFGTQDPHGRERLIEAINLARQEFAKIIVITHLEDLKDQFGAQILVTKGRDGSELRLVGA